MAGQRQAIVAGRSGGARPRGRDRGEAQTTITNIVSIKGRKLVERIAWRRAGQQLGEAEAIASQHAAARFAARVEAQAAPALEQANEQYAAKVRGPLEDRRAFPRSLSFATLASALQISGVTPPLRRNWQRPLRRRN